MTAGPGQDTVGQAGWLRRLLGLAERRPVLSVTLMAALVHLVVAIAVRVAFDGVLFPDDGGYLRLAQQLGTGDTGSWTSYEPLLVRTVGLFLWPLALLLRVVDDPLVGQLWVVAWAVLATAVAAWAGSRAAGARGAWLAGGVVGLMPSHVLWSSIVLKDAVVWTLLAGLLVVTAKLAGSSQRRDTLRMLAATAVLLVGLNYSRPHLTVVAAVALVIAAPVGPAATRFHRLTGAVLVAALVPWALGMGPFGAAFLQDSLGSVEDRRTAAAIGSSTAFVPPPDPEPSVTSDPTAAPETSAEGEPLPLVLARGVGVAVFEPGPWRLFGGRAFLAVAAVEVTLLWYPVLGMAAVGVVRSVRRREPRMVFPVVLGLGILAAQAVTEGNIGTAYRHRVELAVIVAVLAASALSERPGRGGSQVGVG